MIKDFDEFYRTQRPRLFAYFRRLTSLQRVEIEDLIQETFLKFIRHYSTEEINVTPVQYLFCIARSRAVESYAENKCDGLNEVPETGDFDSRLLNGEEIELEALQNAAIQYLPKEDRQLLDMRYLEGKTIDQCAELLGCCRRSVFNHIDRITKTVHDNLGQTNPEQNRFIVANERLAKIDSGSFIETLKRITPLSSAST